MIIALGLFVTSANPQLFSKTTVNPPRAAKTGGPILQPANVDFDGDGKSDVSIVRDESASFRSNGTSVFGYGSAREKMRALDKFRKEGRINSIGSGPGATNVWYNSNSGTGAFTVTGFGSAATDFIVPQDYDGDGMADLAVWRAEGSTSASFFILQSSNGMVVESLFGQPGDNPTVTGDYDGDGAADVAVFRCLPFGGLLNDVATAGWYVN